MRKTAMLLLLVLVPAIMAQSLSIDIVDYRHSTRYMDKEDCYRGTQDGIEMYLTDTIITVRVTAGGSPIPNADVRITYEIKNRSKLERKEEYFKTDVWGEVEIKLPFVEDLTEVRIDAAAQPKEGLGGLSGSMKIIVVPYNLGKPRELLSDFTKNP
jgi:hypothetical protein